MQPQLTDREIQSELGARLRAYRLQQNIALEDLARLARLSKTTLTKMERGGDFRISSLIRVLRVLDRLEALGAFLPIPTLSPMSMVNRGGRGGGVALRQRAWRERGPIASGVPKPSVAGGVGKADETRAPVFEKGSGIARIGVRQPAMAERPHPARKAARPGKRAPQKKSRGNRAARRKRRG